MSKETILEKYRKLDESIPDFVKTYHALLAMDDWAAKYSKIENKQFILALQIVKDFSSVPTGVFNSKYKPIMRPNESATDLRNRVVIEALGK